MQNLTIFDHSDETYIEMLMPCALPYYNIQHL